MVKSWLPYIFTINSHRVGQLEDHGWIVGWLYLLKYSHGKNSTVKPFKQLVVAILMIYQVLQNVDNRGASEKQLAYGWSIVRLTKRKREQDVNAAMDKSGVSQTKNAKKFGVYQIYVQRVFKWEGLKYYKRKLPKSSSWEGCRLESRVGSSWSGRLQSPSATVQAVMDDESYFTKIQPWEVFFFFFDFLRGKVVGRLENQADSKKHRSWLQENDVLEGDLSSQSCWRSRRAWGKLLTSYLESSGTLNT